MTDILNEIVNDPEMIIMTDEEDEVEDFLNGMVDEREPVDPEDVFEKKHQVKESKGPTVQPITKKDKPVKLTKSGRPRKPMSEEALQRLEAGRKKALAARKEKAEQVKREKKKKELKKVINGESSDDEEPPPAPRPAPQPQPQSVSVNAKIDEDVIQKAIQEALEKNEMMRQKRKAEKKAKQKEEVEKAKAQEKIKQAIYPPDRTYMGDQGFWSQNVFFTQ